MSQNRREEEQGQKEIERRRMEEDNKIKAKRKPDGASCESNPTPRSILPLKHGQRRAAGKWRRESRSKSAPMKEEAK